MSDVKVHPLIGIPVSNINESLRPVRKANPTFLNARSLDDQICWFFLR
jgi:hypothetical protein